MAVDHQSKEPIVRCKHGVPRHADAKAEDECEDCALEQPSSKQPCIHGVRHRQCPDCEVERLDKALEEAGEECAGQILEIERLTRENELQWKNVQELLASDERLRALLAKALHEMTHTTAPRNSFTDVVDEIDEALRPADETIARRLSDGSTPIDVDIEDL